MDLSLFDFELPPELIAQEPAGRREDSRLLVYNRADDTVAHRRFADLTEIAPAKARFFRNNVAVLKARLPGLRPSGGKVECLLLHPTADPATWCCLLKPGKKTFQQGTFGIKAVYTATVLEAGRGGSYRVHFRTANGESVIELSERIGIMPLPPYIQRADDDPRHASDSERYQTVYADPAKRLAAAAPTAGLHFTPGLIAALEARQCRFFDLTLEVGLGTFQPIQAEDIREHVMHRETYQIPAEVLQQLQDPAPGPRVAVGTTAVRSIEHAFSIPGGLPPNRAVEAEADLFIYPPARFAAVDGLITNFHLPRSTLLCLVSAFLSPGKSDGIDRLKELYAQAIAEKYRFFSYGDAMLIL